MEVKDHAPEKVVWSSGAEYRLSDLPAVGFSNDYYHKPAFFTWRLVAIYRLRDDD